MRARRQDRQPDDVLGPRALAAMADAARRSREATKGPGTSTPRSDAGPDQPTAVPPDGATVAGPTASAPPTTTGSPVPPFPPRTSSPAVPPRAPSDTTIGARGRVPDPSTRGAARRSVPTLANSDPDQTGAGRDHRPRSSTLIVALSLVAVVAALLGTWAIKGTGGTAPSSSASHPSGPVAPASTAPPTAQAGSSSGGAAATGATTLPPPTTAPPSPTTTPPPATGTGPVLTALTPDSGTAGQVLVIDGSSLLSPSGQITAHFGTVASTVACPAQTSCVVLVPPNAASTAAVPFTVTTDTGTSNALTFSYS